MLWKTAKCTVVVQSSDRRMQAGILHRSPAEHCQMTYHCMNIRGGQSEQIATVQVGCDGASKQMRGGTL
eukprot:scaffold21706_cov25-Tisochrysis_lutea.AAC.1